MISRYYIVAIDGPAGSGKSTIAKLLAKKSRFLYIDSGAMYRAVTLYMIRKNLLACNESKIKANLKKIKIKFVNFKGNQIIYLAGKNVTKAIRSSVVNKLVSEIANKSVIREEMVKQQRQYGFKNSIVMDGRDIGTNVFKDANLKIYLTASALIRAKRRLKDMAKLGEKVSLQQVRTQIINRDNYDSSRNLSPLCKSQDAVVIDSSNLSIQEVLEQIYLFLPKDF